MFCLRGVEFVPLLYEDNFLQYQKRQGTKHRHGNSFNNIQIYSFSLILLYLFIVYSAISRDHVIEISEGGLVTITGARYSHHTTTTTSNPFTKSVKTTTVFDVILIFSKFHNIDNRRKMDNISQNGSGHR
jgi:hypothetical protein